MRARPLFVRVPRNWSRTSLQHQISKPTPPLQRSRTMLSTSQDDIKSSKNTLNASQRALLPSDKHDEDALARLETLDTAALAPLIPELLTWLQDTNWPVARPVLQLLLKHLPLITDPIREILRGDDDLWKWNVEGHLIRKMPREQQSQLIPELERISMHPTTGEVQEEADVAAREILEQQHNLGI